MRAEGFSCSLDVLHGGIGIKKLHFFKDFFGSKIVQFLSSKPRIRIRIETNADSQLLAFLKMEISFADLHKNLSCAGQPVRSLTLFLQLMRGHQCPGFIILYVLSVRIWSCIRLEFESYGIFSMAEQKIFWSSRRQACKFLQLLRKAKNCTNPAG